jgi:hypothetical protein
MRANSAVRLLAGLMLCSAPMFASQAFANSWHRPNIFEESNSDYTNYNYDDGLCQYRYSSNRYEKQVQASRNGDCSHLVIGPDGRVMPMVDDED